MYERGQSEKKWITISSKFPAGLNKFDAETVLEDGSTPDAYGVGIERNGWLYSASAPSASSFDSLSSKTAPTNAPAQVTARYWHYFHNRMFGWDTGSAKVYFGAPGYEATWIKQNNSGSLYVDNGTDSGNITAICPFGNKLAIFKTNSLYIVDGASSNYGQFSTEFNGADFGVTSRLNVISIDNTLFFTNAYGVFAFDGEKVVELTMLVRNSLAPFSSATCTQLKADFDKKYLCITNGTSTLGVIDLTKEIKLYDYNTSGFRFTTPTFQGENGETLLIDKIAFIYKNDSGARWKIGLDIKINDTWKTARTKTFSDEENGRVEFDLDSCVLSCRRWAMRINELSSNVYISAIQAQVKQGSIMGYSNKRS